MNPTDLFDITHWIAMAAPFLAAAVLVVGGITLVVGWQRSRRVEHALGRRSAVELVPTTTFDPGVGEIRRAAHQLTRARYAAGDVPARGAATRIRYSAEDGQMRCYLEGPDAAAAVLRMPAYAEVEVRSARSGVAGAPDLQPVRFTLPSQREGRQ